VAIKMHTGNNMCYSTIHPVFVRRVVQAVKDGGGKPFVVDVNWDTAFAEQRGYSNETIGCPVYPAAGPDEKYFHAHRRTYKNIKRWLVAGLVEDASFLINLPHIRAVHLQRRRGEHRTGCLAGTAMHDIHFDRTGSRKKCRIPPPRRSAACPFSAIVEDKEKRNSLRRVHQCRHCLGSPGT
jgi:uncharacterized Fe-S center protein